MSHSEQLRQYRIRQQQQIQQHQIQREPLLPDNNLNEPLLGGGQGRYYSDFRNQQAQSDNQQTKRDIYTDLMFNVLAMMLIINFGADSHCGISIFMWCLVYFCILSTRSLTNLFKLKLQENQFRYYNTFTIASFIVIDGLLLSWLIYGNILFYSSKNDCNQMEGSRVLYNLMFVLLLVGYFQMLVYALLIFCLPCLIVILRHQERQRAGIVPSSAIPSIIQSLTRLKFDNQQFKSEDQCSICWIEFKSDDEITPLSCDPKHYFHTKCIEDWIRTGKNTCPLCRQPIREL
ncbi:zinc finger protein [Stylonychia lemnae]|uniref:Zinc finger protein n=1 Tax=Stylonychia lemnae TaxID=5949 RepID=A0A078B8S1_STYLE|nr:zinc finger protein [Stylonychia lemnae]|eukprot:CDW90885.1 zinc finger protein [Stylonychia lemnae]